MQPSLKGSRLTLTALMICGALFLAGPAVAQTVLGTFIANSRGVFSGTVRIPAGTALGCYNLTATGTGPSVGPYPPTSTGSLAVSSTAVVAGERISVSGGGFTPGTAVTVSLSFAGGADSGTFKVAQTTVTRTLTARICVVAVGTGVVGTGPGNVIINNNNRVECVSNATATASGPGYKIAQTGADITIKNNNSAKCESTATAIKKIQSAPVVTGVLARTGVDALPLLAAAIATILLGAVLLSAGRRRDRFGGSLRSA